MISFTSELISKTSAMLDMRLLTLSIPSKATFLLLHCNRLTSMVLGVLFHSTINMLARNGNGQ